MSQSKTEFSDKTSEHMNRFRGRLCGAIEAFGLPEKQERGAITLIKTMSYDIEAALKKEIDILD